MTAGSELAGFFQLVWRDTEFLTYDALVAGVAVALRLDLKDEVTRPLVRLGQPSLNVVFLPTPGGMATPLQEAREAGAYGIRVMTPADATGAAKVAAHLGLGLGWEIRLYSRPTFVPCWIVPPDLCELTPKLHQIREAWCQHAAPV